MSLMLHNYLPFVLVPTALELPQACRAGIAAGVCKNPGMVHSFKLMHLLNNVGRRIARLSDTETLPPVLTP